MLGATARVAACCISRTLGASSTATPFVTSVATSSSQHSAAFSTMRCDVSSVGMVKKVFLFSSSPVVPTTRTQPPVATTRETTACRARGVGASVGGDIDERRLSRRARRHQRRLISTTTTTTTALSAAADEGGASAMAANKTTNEGNSRDVKLKNKRLYLIRHGRTEMNDYLAENHWAAEDFIDPGMYDTRLTILGMKQAASLRSVTTALDPPPQVIIASPLSRALMTAQLAFGDEVHATLPREVCALARERVFHASDVGRSPDIIAADFPEWNVDSLRDTPIWWYTGGKEDDPKAVVPEPVVRTNRANSTNAPHFMFNMHDYLFYFDIEMIPPEYMSHFSLEKKYFSPPGFAYN